MVESKQVDQTKNGKRYKLILGKTEETNEGLSSSIKYHSIPLYAIANHTTRK